MTTKIKLSINGTDTELTPDDVRELRRALDAFDSASPYGDVHILIVLQPTRLAPVSSTRQPIYETTPYMPWEFRATCTYTEVMYSGTTNGTVILPKVGKQ